jgi:hypothetical protein
MFRGSLFSPYSNTNAHSSKCGNRKWAGK